MRRRLQVVVSRQVLEGIYGDINYSMRVCRTPRDLTDAADVRWTLEW